MDDKTLIIVPNLALSVSERVHVQLAITLRIKTHYRKEEITGTVVFENRNCRLLVNELSGRKGC